MAERSAIEWTDATFNPWWGCVRVSPACAHCYADTWARRFGLDLWEHDGARRFFGDGHWRRPAIWHRKAAAAREPFKVFCASMADVFEDRRDLDRWRRRLWALIEETPWLRWQLLTKRPENIARMAPWAVLPENVWIGTSIENTRFSFRADILREVPGRVRFISAEPLLASLLRDGGPNRRPLELDGIHWIIVGGESGPRARPMDLEWARELREAAATAGAAFFLKQLGGHPDKRGHEKALLDGRLWRELPSHGVSVPELELAA